MSVDWIDLIRETEPFVLFEEGLKQFSKVPATSYNTFVWDIRTQYQIQHLNASKSENTHRVNIDAALPVNYSNGGPGFIFMTNPSSVNSPSHPFAPRPAPAQQASHMTMIWTKECQTLDCIGFDETVGASPPENAMGVQYDKKPQQYISGSGSTGGTGTFLQYLIEPHRDDGFPAVICTGRIQKHYNNQHQLHRTGNSPALRAEYVGALWFEHGVPRRSNGPMGVIIKDYQEFHRDGVFEGFRCKEIYETWPDPDLIGKFESQMEGKRRPFSNRYFENPSDEMIWLSLEKQYA